MSQLSVHPWELLPGPGHLYFFLETSTRHPLFSEFHEAGPETPARTAIPLQLLFSFLALSSHQP